MHSLSSSAGVRESLVCRRHSPDPVDSLLQFPSLCKKQLGRCRTRRLFNKISYVVCLESGSRLNKDSPFLVMILSFVAFFSSSSVILPVLTRLASARSHQYAARGSSVQPGMTSNFSCASLKLSGWIFVGIHTIRFGGLGEAIWIADRRQGRVKSERRDRE